MAIDYTKDFDDAGSFNSTSKVPFEALPSEPKVEFDVKSFDFDDFASDYSELLQGQVMIDSVKDGAFKNDIKSKFEEYTKCQYSVDFGCDTTSKRPKFYAEFHDNKDSDFFRISTDKSLEYNKIPINNKSAKNLTPYHAAKISNYVSVSTKCADMISDGIEQYMNATEHLERHKYYATDKSGHQKNLDAIKKAMDIAESLSPDLESEHDYGGMC